jgi:lysophospholipase L1-like esterase
MSACEDHQEIALIFLGDSDISRWPEHLYPSLSTTQSLPHRHITSTNFHHAKSGAIMQNLSKQIKKSSRELSGKYFDAAIFIACAGENDVSSDIPIDTIMSSFETVVEEILSFSKSKSWSKPSNQSHLIFIGPKIEPWMTKDELDARKGYFQLSERLNQSCKTLSASVCEYQLGEGHSSTNAHERRGVLDNSCIHYIDCLAMFCGETKGLSVFGGKAIADKRYFEEDELHLSDKGYEVFQREVELVLENIVRGEKNEDLCNDSQR